MYAYSVEAFSRAAVDSNDRNFISMIVCTSRTSGRAKELHPAVRQTRLSSIGEE